MVAAEKEVGPHQQLMKVLFEKTGPIPDGAAQGKAVKWLLEHYEVEECISCLTDLLKRKWHEGRVSWLNVRNEIGTWKMKRGAAKTFSPVPIKDEGEVFTKEDAARLIRDLEEMDSEGFRVQIEQLTTQYNLR